MVSFMNAAMLPALAASLIPLLVHLLYRRRPTDLPFSNLALLIRLQQGRLNLFRRESWLLLLLRTLAVLFLVLAFARPIIGDAGSIGTLPGSPGGRAIVLLIDRSYSMGRSLDGRRLFDAVAKRASGMISALSPEDRLYLIGFSNRAEPLSAGWLSDLEKARNMLANAGPTFASTDIAPALREASLLLRDCPQTMRDLFVLGDLAEHGFRGVQDSTTFFARGVSVWLFRHQAGQVRDASVDSIWVRDRLAAEGAPATISARVSNRGDVPIDPLIVDVIAGGRKMSGTTERLAPGETRDLSFTVPTPLSGRLEGYVAIGEDDLKADNRRFFSIVSQDTLRVVTLGDDVSDLRYVEDALRAGFAPGVVRIDTNVLSTGAPVSPSDRPAGPGHCADLVVVSNVKSPSGGQIRLLEECLKAGGGILVALGDRVDAASYNEKLFPGILPARLIPLSGRAAATEGFLQFDRFDFSHPVLEGLRPYMDALRRPRSRLVYGVEQPGRDVRVPIAFENGLPALCDARRSNGRVLLLNSSLGPRGGDLPVSGIFAPLMQRVAGYLAAPSPASFEICSNAELPVTGDAGKGATAILESPAGDRLTVSTVVRDGVEFWRLGALSSPGIWRIRREGREIGEFAVNVDAAESRRGVVGEARLSRIFAGNQLRYVDIDRPPASEQAPVDAQAPHARELWTACLVAALVLLCLEMIVGRSPAREPAGNRR